MQITHTHRKSVCKDFEIRKLGKYDSYVQSDTLLADVFENLCVLMYLRNMCLEIYDLDPSKFLSAPGLG